MYRTRQYRINSTHSLYSYCRGICSSYARLYNRANFILRQYSSAVKAMDEFKPLFPNQICRIRDELYLRFPGTKEMLRFSNSPVYGVLKEVRIKPCGRDFVIDVVMDTETKGIAPRDDSVILKELAEKADISKSDPGSIIIKMIENNPNITRKTIAEELGLSIDGARYHIKKLTEDGVIKYVGTSRKGYWELLKK